MEKDSLIIQTVVSEIQISYKPKMKFSALPQIITPEDAYKLFITTWETSKIDFREQFKIMLLNTSEKVLGFVRSQLVALQLPSLIRN